MVSNNRISLSGELLPAFLGFALCCGVAQAVATARWISPETSPLSGVAIEIVCRAQWALDDSSLNVLPAETPILSWGSLELLRTESGFEGDQVYVDQVFTLTVAAPGTFILPELEIPYLDDATSESAVISTLVAPSLAIEIRRFNRALYAAAAAIALAAIVAAFVIAFRLRKTNANQNEVANT